MDEGTAQRFWSKVEPTGFCWEWAAFRNKGGYGCFAPNRSTRVLAHRVAYETLVGPIPAGLVIDHLCRNRGCVNPDHLEPVTSKENGLRGYGPLALNARQTSCPQGHEYAGDNLYPDPRGRRGCRSCRRDAVTRYQQGRKNT